VQSIWYKVALTCAKNYQIRSRRFKDKSKNVRWPRFFGPRCISHNDCSAPHKLMASLWFAWHGGAAAGATGAMASPKFWLGATMHLAPPIIGLYIR